MAITKVISYAKLDTENRCDAEHIAAPILLIDNFQYGRDIIEFTQYGTSKALNEQGKGYPILRLNEFENIFVQSPEKHCELITESGYRNLRLLKGDVLVCRTNGNPHLVGKTAVVMEDANCAYASYVFKVRPNKRISAQALTVYLSSKYGRNEIERHQMISIQTNFSPERFKKCRIPYFTEPFQVVINDLVNQAYYILKRSKTLYADAEKYLFDALGMSDFIPSGSKFSIRGLADSFRSSNRIDAEYYQQKYEDLQQRLSGLKCKRLDDAVWIMKSIEPGSMYYCDEGVPFVRVSDVTKFGIQPPAIKIPDKIVQPYLYPKRDTILLSKDGSVGIAYKVEKNLKCVTSGALLHLTVKRGILPDYLTLLLNSIIVQFQAERDAGGS
ncbi:MAG: hypothetical protein LBI03_00680, partial [Clostridiales bacterium]|nr:hypothetical protein [Clostridiales bacterium]